MHLAAVAAQVLHCKCAGPCCVAGGKGFGDPVTFDNTYYTALLKKPWLNTKDEMAQMIGLPSDHALPEDPDCLKLIEAYAADQQLFFRDFAEAYVKLTNLGAVWA